MRLPKSKASKVFREPRRTAKLRAWYQGQLFDVCRQIDEIIADISGKYEPITEAGMIMARLNAYSGELDEWARFTADRMIDKASAADYAVWLKTAVRIGRETRKLLKTAGIGSIYNQLQQEEVELIKSIPLEAAQKVQEWTKEGLGRNERPEQIAKRIQSELAPITRNRAVCIARTETARARSNFTQARAKAVGSTHYKWHTVGDSRVRPMHTDLDGSIQSWSNPPVCDLGRGGQPLHAHPGCIFNCRCWAEPIFDDEESS